MTENANCDHIHRHDNNKTVKVIAK